MRSVLLMNMANAIRVMLIGSVLMFGCKTVKKYENEEPAEDPCDKIPCAAVPLCGGECSAECGCCMCIPGEGYCRDEGNDSVAYVCDDSGECYNRLPCAEGTLCDEDNAYAECVTDPCHEVTCGPTPICGASCEEPCGCCSCEPGAGTCLNYGTAVLRYACDSTGTCLETTYCNTDEICVPGEDGHPHCLTPTEEELIDVRSNDNISSAQPLLVGGTVYGTIGFYGVTAGEDIDYYAFEAPPNTVLEITLTNWEGADYHARASIVSEEYVAIRKVLADDGDPGTAKRQFFISHGGTYYVRVVDARNTDPESKVGGKDVAYALSVTEGIPRIEDVNFPLEEQPAFVSDARVIQYVFNADLGQGIEATALANLLTPPSDVDPSIFILDNTAFNPVLLVENEDISADNFDASARTIAHNAGEHLVMLDHYAINGDDARCEVSLDTFDTTEEWEPNEQPDTDTASLIIPDLTTSGTIFREDDQGSLIDDVDCYQLRLEADTYIEVLITKDDQAAGPFVAYISFLDPDGQVFFSNPNRAVPATENPRLEAYAFQTGIHFVCVGDIRNVHATDSFVGGQDYVYTIHINEIPRTVHALNKFPVLPDGFTPNSIAAAIDQSGKTAWYTFDVTQTAKMVWIDFDLSTHASADGFSLNPWVTLLMGTDQHAELLAAGNRFLLRDIPLVPFTYTLAISDTDGGHSTDHHAFLPRIVARTELGMVTDIGGNYSRARAMHVDPLPVFVEAHLSAGIDNWYGLGTLETGLPIAIETQPAVNGGEVDTIVVLYRDGSIAAVGQNDDMSGSTFSRLELVVEETDTYYLLVKGHTQASGDHNVMIQTGACPRRANDAEAGHVFFNELFTDPASPDGDANGDGLVNNDDQFVELVNFSERPRTIDRFVLRDAVGNKKQFSCGTLLDANTSHVVFGGCTPGGGVDCTTLDLANMNPMEVDFSETQGFEFPSSNHMVLLLDELGRMMDRVIYDVSTENISFARGTGGQCDTEPTSETLQLHDACTDPVSAAPFTPFNMADNSEFVAILTPAGETCEVAIPITAGTLHDETLSGLASDYAGKEYACTSGYASSGPDQVYSIVVPAGKILTIFLNPTDTDFDPSVYVIGGSASHCNVLPRPCLSGADAAGPNEQEIIDWKNLTGQDATVFIIVDTFSMDYAGPSTYDLAVSLD